MEHLHTVVVATLNVGNHLTLWCYALAVSLLPPHRNDVELMDMLTSFLV